MEFYGRHRDSIADLEAQLHDIIARHPQASTSSNGEPEVPSRLMPEIFREFQLEYGGAVVEEEEIAAIEHFVQTRPEVQVVTPSMLIPFLAQKTKHSPPDSPTLSHERSRGSPTHSRSSSREGDAYSRPRSSSRGPPQTPKPSPFDKRQRTGASIAPSSWQKPPPHRRKSDAGSRSDSEYSGTPSSFRRTPGGRSRAPSNPTSPDMDVYSPPGSARSPNFSSSRPPSRSGRYNNGYSSPEEYEPTLNRDQFLRSISSLHMPRRGHHDDEDDDDNAYDDMDLVHDRRSSTMSLEPEDKVDILSKSNEELARKLREAERTLLHTMAQHEGELEELQGRLDEVKSELSATKREEKELRSKERINQNQISELETEVNKLTKQLETARSTYSNLNKMYQEQIQLTDQHRHDLRDREQEINHMKEAASLHDLETDRWLKEQAQFDDRIHRLEAELDIAARAQEELDAQKQENLLLKETIDRMKFDIDELRSRDHWGGSSSAQSSAPNSISRSLGAELSAKLKDGKWDMDDEDEDGLSPPSLASEIIEEEEITEGEDDEDVVQTIITRKKRKVASRANQMGRIETHTYEEVKEYSDTATQYDSEPFMHSSSSQTDPPPIILTASTSTQTHAAVTSGTAVQTDAEPEPEPVVEPQRVSMEIQTEDIEEDIETETDDPAPSSSHSAGPSRGGLSDTFELPPAYDGGAESASTLETLKHWHAGAKLPGPGQLKVSPEMAAEWQALKAELGFTCKVIDEAVGSSTDSAAESGASSSSSSTDNKNRRRASSKFYNIYNTYIYDRSSTSVPHVTQAVMWAAGAAFLMYMNLHMAYPHPAAGPTLYDRYAWQSWNSIGAAGEGFGGAMDGVNDGGAGSNGVVWDLIGRVGGGAARIARGWPT